VTCAKRGVYRRVSSATLADVEATLAREIETRISAALQDDLVPQIILDLDGTLFDNVPRSKRVLVDAAGDLFGKDTALPRAIDAIAEEAFDYNPIDTLRARGVGDEATLAALREEWARRFFGDEYLSHDVPLAGSVEAARRWWERGAELNYLTGRHVPEMLLGTCRSLHEAGFPLGTIRTQLLMKPAFDVNDVTHKIDMVPYVRRKGPIVLIVDNDPRVLNALAAAVDGALAVMVKTLHPKDAPALAATAVAVDDFRDLL
jgi:phosphoglycolate phosphatase-like HAD superfamily hydrolase